MSKPNTYDADSVQILEGLEAVRRRPGMYIGSTSSAGLHHLIWEVVDNAVDEALAGACTEVTVTLEADGSVSVADNGRGIPVATHPQTGVSTLTTVLTTLHAGGKFGGGGYKVSGGLHGVGVSVVNALSRRLDVTVRRDGHEWTQSYVNGVPKAEPKRGRATTATGTTVRFWPSKDIFESVEFDGTVIERRLRQAAYLTPELTLKLVERRPTRDASEVTYRFSGGIADYVSALVNRTNEGKVLPKPVSIHDRVNVNGGEPIDVNVALSWTKGYDEQVRSFVNNVSTVDGGTHEEGFARALTRTLNDAARKQGILKTKDPNLRGDDLREGLVAVISVRMAEPQFEGQTKGKLGSSAARTAVEQVVGAGLATWIGSNRSHVKAVLTKARSAAKAREAARAAKDIVRRKTILETSSLPGKLADCRTHNTTESELFLVEGDSAMGSGKQARDARFQALLPLRGKILNTWTASTKRMLDNQECAAIATAVGAGIGRDFDESKLRYGKIVLLTDADVDGAHIRILLLTFFWKYMRALVEKGRLYVAQPPLYRVELSDRSEVRYSYTEAAHRELIDSLDAAGVRYRQPSRYKGLGEMPAEELERTVMNPGTRVLKQVHVDDAETAADVMDMLMGRDAAARRAFIVERADGVTLIDV